jgi:hypothetical protein
LRRENDNLRQSKPILPFAVVAAPDRSRTLVRQSVAVIRIADADFFHMRSADFACVTAGRLILIVNRLRSRVEVMIMKIAGLLFRVFVAPAPA